LDRDETSWESTEPLVRAAREVGVRDERVLAQLREVRRELFVPPAGKASAYQDAPVPTGHREVTTQPSLVALMVQALHLRGRERVLEVGTGLGYEAAILSSLCREVYTIERHRDFAQAAHESLMRGGFANVSVVEGDGTLGLVRHAPYDGIIVAAAAPQVPSPLVTQLADGGRLVQPIGPGGNEVVTVFRKLGGRLRQEGQLGAAVFVPLVTESYDYERNSSRLRPRPRR
jgi:protein-L-isoaspartate(D-aspartate) O-methyltransferase